MKIQAVIVRNMTAENATIKSAGTVRLQLSGLFCIQEKRSGASGQKNQKVCLIHFGSISSFCLLSVQEREPAENAGFIFWKVHRNLPRRIRDFLKKKS